MIAMKSREFFVCVLLYRAIRKAYIIKDKKRRPSNSKAGEKKKRWPGDMKGLRNNAPTIGLLREEKEKVPGGGGWSPARALCYC